MEGAMSDASLSTLDFCTFTKASMKVYALRQTVADSRCVRPPMRHFPSRLCCINGRTAQNRCGARCRPQAAHGALAMIWRGRNGWHAGALAQPSLSLKLYTEILEDQSQNRHAALKAQDAARAEKPVADPALGKGALSRARWGAHEQGHRLGSWRHYCTRCARTSAILGMHALASLANEADRLCARMPCASGSIRPMQRPASPRAHFSSGISVLAATEVDDADGTRAAQALLGHTTEATPANYIRHKASRKVKPLRW